MEETKRALWILLGVTLGACMAPPEEGTRRDELRDRTLENVVIARMYQRNHWVVSAVDPRTDRAAAAQYVCDAAFADWTRGVVARGVTTGAMIDTARGAHGFGYDPYFVSDELGVTFGEATREAKEAVSHRGRAFRALLDEPCRPLKEAPVTGSRMRLSATSRLHMASAGACCVGSIWPERSLIAMAGDGSVIVRSLIRSSAFLSFFPVFTWSTERKIAS